jgi:hypothetical protein
LTAIANMREVGRRPAGALMRVELAESPPLPTYLVALAVGAFDLREGREGALPIRLVAPSGKAGLGAAALAAGRAQLVELERYFGRPYPYTKLDLLAVPARLRRDGERRAITSARSACCSTNTIAGGAHRDGQHHRARAARSGLAIS